VVRVFGEISFARSVILVIAVLVPHALSGVGVRVVIVINASLFVHIIVVRVSLGIIEVEQVAMVGAIHVSSTLFTRVRVV
jgi:hypothetical protein